MQKETIVFVHGAWHGKWCWDKYFRPAFIQRGYEVITFDLPGHDRPGKIPGMNRYRIRDYVMALEEIVSGLESAPVIIGHSMGGLVVQKFLERNTCKKVVLLASVPPFGVINSVLRYLKKPFAYPALLGFDLYKLVNSPTKSREAFFSPTLSENDLQEYTEQLCSESFLAFVDMIFPRIKMKYHRAIPLLVVGAKNDTIFLENEVRSTAQFYQAPLLLFEDMAHDMMLDVGQEKVSQAIMYWLEGSDEKGLDEISN